jgi:hypothetical protein
MITHFCGWENIQPLLRTNLGEEVLQLSTEDCDEAALRVIIEWMYRVVKEQWYVDSIEVPTKDLVFASKIKRVLWTFGCREDVKRFNRSIAYHYFRRPLNHQKADKLYTAFPLHSIPVRFLAVNLHYSLNDKWKVALPSKFKRKLRTFLNKHEDLKSEVENFKSAQKHYGKHDIMTEKHSLQQAQAIKGQDHDDWELPDDYESIKRDLNAVLKRCGEDAL